jgi:flagellar hook-length control protein FliK
MSFDAFIMPPAPAPAAGGANGAPGTPAASFKLDRPAQAGDPKESFTAALNRISERKSCGQSRSRAGETLSAKRAPKTGTRANPDSQCRFGDQEPVQDRAAESEPSGSAQESLSVRAESPLALFNPYLFNMAFADESAVTVDGQSDTTSGSTDAFLNRLMGRFYSDGQAQLAGLVGIGPFEQLQTGVSAEAHNLHFFKQLAARALHDQLATDPSGRRAGNPFFEFWRSLVAAPAESGGLGGRTEATAISVDDLIHFMLQRYGNTSATSGLSAAATGDGGQQPAVTMETLNADQHLLLQKMSGAAQPVEAQTAMAGKNGHGSAGIPNELNAATLLEPRHHKDGGNSAASRMQPAPKTAEPAVNPNLAAEGIATKPVEDAFSFKTSGLQHEMLSADQTGNKVIQIDGEAKDSGFLASQENLPEQMSKLEHSSRSAEGTQRSLATQTMNQIVQKAVLLNNNGQSTIQIDLKPDFLGQIRMQIVTESQQVAVRIVAELPFVKDMLESNLNQLKAELEAQGLEVDELEVSVAHDSRAEDDRYQRAAEARRARASKNDRSSADEIAEAQTDRPAGHRHGMAETAIDYFA